MVNFNFEYDPLKEKTNQKKHNISFEESTSIFLDPNIVTIYDEDHSENEDRWLSIGTTKNGKILVVSHTFMEIDKTNISVRLISARKATKIETGHYRESL